MRILSFDTSSCALHLSLLEGNSVTLEKLISPSNDNRNEVGSLALVHIAQAFQEVDWERTSLNLVAVGIGPGSFTGIRVAVIIARTIAQQLNLPLIGISSLETAFAAANCPSPGAIIFSTTSGKFFWGSCTRDNNEIVTRLSEPRFGSSEELLADLKDIPQANRFADAQALAILGDSACSNLPQLGNIASPQAHLALQRLHQQQKRTSDFLALNQTGAKEIAAAFPWWQVVPLYLRSPAITLKQAQESK